ncbi:MAG TPA: hypothetical protein VHC73_10725 [Vitreimonas sp.]|jgi:hypothetical protein|nr:hypothetical protein [Vitreimonas sp.]
MNAADWRALIEAYLDGRLSAEAFMRRFMQAWREGHQPRAIADLYPHVEGFEADVTAAAEEGAVNDDEMRAAARQALSWLYEGPGVTAQTFDRTRAREDIRRFTFQMTGCVGIGCFIGIAWLVLCLLQINYVIVELQTLFGREAPIISAFFGFFLAFVPVVGNVLAYLGATKSGWAPLLAAIVFFAAPAVTMLSGWSRWRSYRR